MNILKFGFEFRNNILYNVVPKKIPKGEPLPPIKPETYEDMLKEIQIPVDVFVERLNNIIKQDQRTRSMATPVPGMPYRSADAQAIVDKLNKIQQDWRELHNRYRDPASRYLSPKTYLRYIGTIRRQITNMITIPNLRPLNEEDLLRAYEQAGRIKQETEQEREIIKTIM